MSYDAIPLTPEQRDFAVEHHRLVYRFLGKHHLPMDDFYDVIIFGYLRAVKRYLTDCSLHKYAFTTIAWGAMRSDLSTYRRKQTRQMRTAEVLSLHIGFGPNNNYPLEETIPDENKLMQELEEQLLLHELAGKISSQQMDLVRRKTYGYKLHEIARHQKTSVRRIKELLDEVYPAFLEVCRES